MDLFKADAMGIRYVKIFLSFTVRYFVIMEIIALNSYNSFMHNELNTILEN